MPSTSHLLHGPQSATDRIPVPTDKHTQAPFPFETKPTDLKYPINHTMDIDAQVGRSPEDADPAHDLDESIVIAKKTSAINALALLSPQSQTPPPVFEPLNKHHLGECSGLSAVCTPCTSVQLSVAARR